MNFFLNFRNLGKFPLKSQLMYKPRVSEREYTFVLYMRLAEVKL